MRFEVFRNTHFPLTLRGFLEGPFVHVQHQHNSNDFRAFQTKALWLSSVFRENVAPQAHFPEQKLVKTLIFFNFVSKYFRK